MKISIGTLRVATSLTTGVFAVLGLGAFVFFNNLAASAMFWTAAAGAAAVHAGLLIRSLDQARSRLNGLISDAQAEEKHFGVSNPDYGKVDWRELEKVIGILRGE